VYEEETRKLTNCSKVSQENITMAFPTQNIFPLEDIFSLEMYEFTQLSNYI
jgi:hypothetical protein